MTDTTQRALEEIARQRPGYPWSDPGDVDLPPDVLEGKRKQLIASLSREQRLQAEGRGVPALGGTPGQRLTSSLTWAAWRDQADVGFTAERAFVPVAEPDELVEMAATLDFVDHPIERFDVNAIKPRSSPLDFVTVVPATAQVTRGVSLTGTEPDGWGVPGAPDPAASIEVVLTADGENKTLIRWAGHGRGRRAHILDDQFVRRLVDRVMTRGWFRSLAHEILVGDGSTTASRIQLTGIENTTGIGSVAVATDDYTAALLDAVAVVENAGFDGPHVAIFNPVDKRAVLGHAGWRADRFPTLAAVVGFDKIPSGVGFVGQVGAANLYSTGLGIEVRGDHADDFTKGLVTVQPFGFVEFEVPQPGAFCEITGL